MLRRGQMIFQNLVPHQQSSNTFLVVRIDYGDAPKATANPPPLAPPLRLLRQTCVWIGILMFFPQFTFTQIFIQGLLCAGVGHEYWL